MAEEGRGEEEGKTRKGLCGRQSDPLLLKDVHSLVLRTWELLP